MAVQLKKLLADWRRRNQLVQKQAADILGVNIRTYEGWEYGRASKQMRPFVFEELTRRMNEYEKQHAAPPA